MEYEEKRRELVITLKRLGRIYSREIEDAFLKIPRELFVPKDIRKLAYVDTPLEIGKGQTISAPHMVAIMAEALDLKKGQKVLEIGAGSGYHAAIISKMIGGEGHVYSIERIKSLTEFAKKNIKTAGIKNVTIVNGDGSEGLPKYAPYDRIYVTCAAPEVPPPLIEQLNDEGKLMVPVGKMICELKLLEKNGDRIITKDLGGCAFVPLIGKYGH
jgi:protein-L-isoaspartate(D-aspartate) O-methyltransferase